MTYVKIHEKMTRILISAKQSKGPVLYCPKIEWTFIIAGVSATGVPSHTARGSKMDLKTNTDPTDQEAPTTSTTTPPVESCREVQTASTDLIQRATRSTTRVKVSFFPPRPLIYCSLVNVRFWDNRQMT